MTNASDLYQAFIEKTGQAFFAYDLDSYLFSYLSPRFKKVFNINESLSVDALLGMVHIDDQAYITECYKELTSKKACENIEFRIQAPGQEEQWVCLNTSIVEVDSGQNMIVGHAEDITSQRMYNNHLKKFSNKKNSVLNILSHDLAAPLGMIQNLTGVLTEELGDNLNSEALHIIGLIEKTSRHGSDLLHEFMNQEFLESSQTDLVTRRVNLVEKMKEAMDEYQGEKADLLAKKVEFICSSKEIYTELDDLKFLQVITNLISNSLKFTPDGGYIKVSLEEEETNILVTVADNGVGIPKKYQATLFDKFTSARRPGLKGERSVGLGMSICKTIVDWHKGQIWFESEENKGTTFYIRLPKV